MNGREKGFLLLSSHLGDPARRVLTPPQLRKLAQRIAGSKRPMADRELSAPDMIALGYSRQEAERILQLLSDEQQLYWYMHKGARNGCRPITRVSDTYPLALRKRLGLDSPGGLWMKGDLSVLQKPAIALVGSRELRAENREFAYEAGRQAARQNYVLVSGNARGADTVAQEACLASGGQVISVVADRLESHKERAGVLYISEDGFDLEFSAQRALSRNRVIHCLGNAVLVAQCTYGKGGTWDGTTQNLQRGWSGVFCYNDGSRAATELCQQGAQLIGIEQLSDLTELKTERNLFD